MSEEEKEPSFEKAFTQLEKIVVDLERGNLDLSASLATYEQGVRLLARCQSLLENVDRSVALLTGVDVDGSPITTAFDASATSAVVSAAPEPAVTKAKPPTRKSSPAKPPTPVRDDSDVDPPF